MTNKIKSFIETVFRMFLLVSTFTSIDMIYHYLYEENYGLYHVDNIYYINKLVWGTVLAIIGFYVINYILKWNKYSYKKTSVFSLIIAVPLQIRYYFTGHFTPFQNLTILVAHYSILEILLIIYYKLYKVDYII